ncbi:MAG: SRPBCC domain-containing protein [Gammaproteobacteria bacterium]|nr:SRPBCC domain-containing protein [Gammaproteobacteria bacterium]
MKLTKFIVLALLFVSSNAYAFFEKYIYTEITINTPVEAVWAVLVNNQDYPNWNPYHVRVEGQLKKGEKLFVKIHKPNGAKVEIEPHVMRIYPFKELTWGGGIKGIFFGEHVFLLEAIDANTTRLIQKEEFSGIAIPFAALEAIEEGYTQMNEALKQKLETNQ